jgi:murein DD-endopeptidase MepM/ murein hydrolase activator NlpD
MERGHRRKRRSRDSMTIMFLPSDQGTIKKIRVSPWVVSSVIVGIVLFMIAFGCLFYSHITSRSYIDCLLASLNDKEKQYQQALYQIDEQRIRLELYASKTDSFRAQLALLEGLSEEVIGILEETGTISPEAILTKGYTFPDWDNTANIGGGIGYRVDLNDWISDNIDWIQEQLSFREASLVGLVEEAKSYRELLERTPSLWPVLGRISSTYGWRPHPISDKQQFHDGIDIAAPAGTKVRATATGTVTLARDHGGYGLTVIIDHGSGVTTLYAHNQQIFVRKGQVVNKGDIIAAVGSTGVSTGPHLHYEVRQYGKPTNPYPYLP